MKAVRQGRRQRVAGPGRGSRRTLFGPAFRLCAAALLAILSIRAPTPLAAEQLPAWRIETIDGPGNVGTCSAMAVVPPDAGGGIGIAYWDETGGRVKLAEAIPPDNREWTVSVVDASGSVGGDLGLVYDADARPHVAYQDTTFGIRHAVRGTNGAWTITPVDPMPDPDTFLPVPARIALLRTGSGTPLQAAIAYIDPVRGLRFARQENGSWVVETVDPNGIDACAMAISPVDRSVHIAYRHETESGQGQLRRAFWNGSTWTTEIIDAFVGEFGGECSLAFEAIGRRLHLAYTDDSGSTLRHGVLEGAPPWEMERVDGVEVWFPRLAVDSAGTPYIAYGDLERGVLRYAVPSPTGDWLTTTVAEFGGFCGSIALSSGGRMVLSGYDGRDGKQDVFVAEQLDPTASLPAPLPVSLAVDGTRRTVTLRFPTAPGFLYQAEHSDDLGEWPVIESAIPGDGSDRELVEAIRDGLGGRAFRVRVMPVSGTGR